MSPEALVFDVDGSLAVTGEPHRVSCNAVFEAQGLERHWDVPLYAQLLNVTGGRERLRYSGDLQGFSRHEMPDSTIAAWR